MDRRLVLALVLVAACKDSAKQRAQEAVSGKDFWPEAPKPTTKSGTRTLRYQPANLTHFRIAANGGTPASPRLTMSFDLTLDIDLAAGKTPAERDAKVKLLDFSMHAADLSSAGSSQKMKMRIDDKGMFIDDGSDDPQTWTRAEPGPFDINAMLDTPFATLSFDGQRMESRPIAGHPFEALQMGDMLDSGFMLFPELPAASIAPGHRWKTTHNTAVGSTGARVDVALEMTYAGDGACPSGATTCSLINLVAASKDVNVMSNGMQFNVSYGFAGKIYFNYERGSLDESRVHFDIDVQTGGTKLAIGATYVVTP